MSLSSNYTSLQSCVEGKKKKRAASPVPGLVGAADPAALFGDDETKVHPQSAVSGTSVRPHMSTRLHHRELNLNPTHIYQKGKHKQIKTHTLSVPLIYGSSLY